MNFAYSLKKTIEREQRSKGKCLKLMRRGVKRCSAADHSEDDPSMVDHEIKTSLETANNRSSERKKRDWIDDERLNTKGFDCPNQQPND